MERETEDGGLLRRPSGTGLFYTVDLEPEGRRSRHSSFRDEKSFLGQSPQDKASCLPTSVGSSLLPRLSWLYRRGPTGVSRGLLNFPNSLPCFSGSVFESWVPRGPQERESLSISNENGVTRDRSRVRLLRRGSAVLHEGFTTGHPGRDPSHPRTVTSTRPLTPEHRDSHLRDPRLDPTPDPDQMPPPR